MASPQRTSTELIRFLDNYYDTYFAVASSPSEANLSKFGALFVADATTNLKSTREPTASGREAAITSLEESLKVQRLLERRVVSQAADSVTLTVYCQMNNRLEVMGEVLDPYEESAVVRFNEEGLIEDLKFYGCRSGIVRIVQNFTGQGPYCDHTEEQKRMMETESCCS